MSYHNYIQPDTTIISMVVQNNESAWEHLYDKYAPMMYGTILNMTGDKAIAGEIFKEAFVELKEKKMLCQIYTALCHCLIRHTYKLTLRYLNARGLMPVSAQPFNGNYPLIHLMCFELVTLKEASKKSNVKAREVPRRLREEFSHLCNYSKNQTSVPALNKLGIVN